MKKVLGVALAVILTTSAAFSDFKISQLTAKGSVTGAEQIPVNDAGTNKSITPANIAAYEASLSQTLTNKTITSPVISTISNSGTITLPTGTRTLVGRDTTDTLTNKTISGSSNTITNVSLTTGVAGTLPLANGGTGQTSASTAVNALVPSQTGNSGKVLGTNGTAVSWVAASAASCSGCVTTNIQDISGVTVDNSSNDEGSILDTWISTHKTNQILYVPPGVYDFDHQVGETGLSNFKVQCDPGAIFRKKSAIDTNESGNHYFFQFVQGTNVIVEGCRFEGITTETTGYRTGDQGLVCHSCNGFYVRNNYFKDIGDAAVRSTEYPTGGIAAQNTHIEDNTFENISQITTTPDVGAGRGTSNIWVVNNKFIDIKWSVKMCTRATGPSGIHVIGNEIDSSSEANLTNLRTSATATATGVGVELCSVSDVWVEDNNISNSQVAGIYGYTNPNYPAFTWGNWRIRGNNIYNTWLGIKVENKVGSDAVFPTVGNISVTDNTIRNVWHPTNGYSIWFAGGGTFDASQAKDNIIRDPVSGLYKTIPGAGVTYADNIED